MNFLKKAGSSYILLIVFLIFGIVLAVQLKSMFYIRSVSASGRLSVDVLKERLAREKAEIEEIKAAIDENMVIKNNFIKEYIERQNDDQLAREWEKIRIYTGLVDVKGPGIVITMDDAPARQPDTPVFLLIIHDQDIKVILNDLKKAGAQAIAVNGERIVPMSDLVCAGPTILINDNRYSVPYVIEAIGDPDALYEGAVTSQRIAEMMQFDIRVEITKEKEIKLKKFSGADKLDRYISGLEVVAE